jgi:hypothetical protein
MTICSARAPKLKEVEVGEGSSPGATIQLDFSSKVELVIRTSTKNAFFHPPAFGDTEVSTRSKIMLLRWGYLFTRINWEDYPKFISHNDLDVRTLDDQFFPNIRWSCLHMVSFQTPMFACIETMG